MNGKGATARQTMDHIVQPTAAGRCSQLMQSHFAVTFGASALQGSYLLLSSSAAARSPAVDGQRRTVPGLVAVSWPDKRLLGERKRPHPPSLHSTAALARLSTLRISLKGRPQSKTEEMFRHALGGSGKPPHGLLGIGHSSRGANMKRRSSSSSTASASKARRSLAFRMWATRQCLNA